MEIRRPIAALFATLTIFGGGATLTACGAAGEDQNDGTTDDTVETVDPEDADRENLPDNHNQQPNDEDDGDDQMDPD